MRKTESYPNNEMKLEFDALSVNESFARTAVAAFISQLNPTLEEISDVKTAISEAVTNAVIHAYDEEYYLKYHQPSHQPSLQPSLQPSPQAPNQDDEKMKVYIHCELEKDTLHVEIWDKGKGITNIDLAMEPLYTEKPEQDRSGMGFAFMEAFMDDLEVISEPGFGTTILMKKNLKNNSRG
ncbi:MAG: anti-sigma F factor [Lachnospiraceae bacterium]|nr:anti-sigma F factor [Lachnospiraceae bacterium]